MDTSKIGRAVDTDDTIAAKLAAQLDRLLAQWPDARHDVLRATLARWSEALAPVAAE